MGQVGEAVIFVCPSHAALKKPHKQTNKPTKAVYAQKVALFLLLKNVYTSKIFQFQLRRKVAAKIDAPECAQAEELLELDGRKLDAIRWTCAC